MQFAKCKLQKNSTWTERKRKERERRHINQLQYMKHIWILIHTNKQKTSYKTIRETWKEIEHLTMILRSYLNHFKCDNGYCGHIFKKHS